MGLSLLTILFIIWAVFTTVLVLLVIYRSVVEMHEDDQLFLDDETSKQMRAEHDETLARLRKVRPYIRALTAASALLILVIAGIWLYQGLVIRG